MKKTILLLFCLIFLCSCSCTQHKENSSITVSETVSKPENYLDPDIYLNFEMNIQLDPGLEDAFKEYAEKFNFSKESYVKSKFEHEKVDGLSDDEVNMYIENLRKEGWVFLFQESDNKYTFIKGNDVLTLLEGKYKDIDKDKDKDIAKDNMTLYNLDISIEKGCEDTSPERTSNETAKNMIQKYINAHPSDDYRYGKTVLTVVEKESGEIYKKMGVQIFAAYTKDEYIGIYCIYGQSGCEALYYGHLYTADVDGDNEYELVRLCDVGSGLFVMQMDVYKLVRLSDSDDSRKGIYKAYTVQYVHGHDTSTIIIY